MIRAIFLFAVAAVFGQGPPQPPPYVLGPGDQITIRSIDLEEISEKPVLVDPDGYLSLPLVGRLKAAGLTAAELEKALVKALQGYFRRPQVSVTMTKFGSQPVTVLGAVSAPGVYQLQGRKTLAEVLALAKGLTPEAGSTVTVTRIPEHGPIPLASATIDKRGYAVAEIDPSKILEAGGSEQNIVIMAHDLISVARARLLYVLGEVRKPGGFPLGSRQRVSVLEALSMAEGFSRTAAPHKARILRVVAGSPQRKEMPVDLNKIMSSKEPNRMMEPDDILVVPNNAAKSATLRGIEAAIQMGTGVVIWRQAR
jgi:polysaccharide export outer membrane protein